MLVERHFKSEFVSLFLGKVKILTYNVINNDYSLSFFLALWFIYVRMIARGENYWKDNAWIWNPCWSAGDTVCVFFFQNRVAFHIFLMYKAHILGNKKNNFTDASLLFPSKYRGWNPPIFVLMIWFVYLFFFCVTLFTDKYKACSHTGKITCVTLHCSRLHLDKFSAMLYELFPFNDVQFAKWIYFRMHRLQQRRKYISLVSIHEAKNNFWLALGENGWCGEILFYGIGSIAAIVTILWIKARGL